MHVPSTNIQHQFVMITFITNIHKKISQTWNVCLAAPFQFEEIFKYFPEKTFPCGSFSGRPKNWDNFLPKGWP
jgi:hypothetical protein